MSVPLTSLRRLAVAGTTLGLVAGCGAVSGSGDSAGVQVTTSMYPLSYVAERIAGEHAEIVNLTDPGIDPHELELSVQQTADVADADLVVYVAGLQPAVDETVAQHGPDAVVEAGEVVDLAPLAEGPGHEGETQEEHEEHAHGETDPHFWLDPERLATLAGAVEQRLAEVAPRHAEDFAGNLRALQADLAELDEEYRTGLAECQVDTVVVSHDAFGYLEKYGLHFEPIAGLSPDAEPSPVHLAQLADVVRDEQVTTVFSEQLASKELARTLARELDLQTAVLDPLEGLGPQTADEDYLSLMRANLDALREANRCR